MKFLVHYRVLENYRWVNDAALVEGGDDEMAEDNARIKILATWGKDAAYQIKLTEKVED